MTTGAKIETKPFAGKRVVVRTRRSLDDVLNRLRSVMGLASNSDFSAVLKDHPNEAEFTQEVEERFVGKSGFMLFAVFDHSGWLPLFGIKPRVVRLILGNPLLAITMIRHDITAGLFAPVELLVTDNPDGAGSTITYVLPSSLMVIEENKPLLDAARELDKKLAALVAHGADE
ncbi:DUF302 domain-containing protein [Hyphomicrobium sp. 99]|uniref:DUF302 domain-containing protein n=1 Tax=Hyphomicrobium sp. 99 TaxID=1163419 RepID=UPI0005F843AC|nr:DUF302 domain-containing protein [Hyphomicrobium sp. 99]